MEGVEQDRLAERTTMGAALDQMLVGQLDEQGLGLDEALEAAEAEAEAAAAATAAAAVAATRAGGSAGPHASPAIPWGVKNCTHLVQDRVPT